MFALQPTGHTYSSYMGAFLEEYLVLFLFFSDKIVKLVGGGSVINGPTPSRSSFRFIDNQTNLTFRARLVD